MEGEDSYVLTFFSLQGEEPEEKTTEKMSYKVRLTKFDESKKVALIKQIKALIEGMNLVQVSSNEVFCCYIFSSCFLLFRVHYVCPHPRTHYFSYFQAKKFVESAPTDVKSDLTKAEAEELQKKLEEAGGSTELI